jgi:hypothetical protein
MARELWSWPEFCSWSKSKKVGFQTFSKTVKEEIHHFLKDNSFWTLFQEDWDICQIGTFVVANSWLLESLHVYEKEEFEILRKWRKWIPWNPEVLYSETKKCITTQITVAKQASEFTLFRLFLRLLLADCVVRIYIPGWMTDLDAAQDITERREYKFDELYQDMENMKQEMESMDQEMENMAQEIKKMKAHTEELSQHLKERYDHLGSLSEEFYRLPAEKLRHKGISRKNFWNTLGIVFAQDYPLWKIKNVQNLGETHQWLYKIPGQDLKVFLDTIPRDFKGTFRELVKIHLSTTTENEKSHNIVNLLPEEQQFLRIHLERFIPVTPLFALIKDYLAEFLSVQVEETIEFRQHVPFLIRVLRYSSFTATIHFSAVAAGIWNFVGAQINGSSGALRSCPISGGELIDFQYEIGSKNGRLDSVPLDVGGSYSTSSKRPTLTYSLTKEMVFRNQEEKLGFLSLVRWVYANSAM